MIAVVGKSLLMWLVLLAAMTGNGFVRVFVLQPRLGEEAARRAASLAGVGIIFALAGLFVGTLDKPGSRSLLRVGLLWLVLTVGFELLFGRFVSGAGWESLFADYDVLRGRLPWLWGRLLARKARSVP